MSFPLPFRRRPRLERGLAWLILASSAAACGPDFPNTFYAASKEALLAAPEGIFAREVARLVATDPTLPRAVRVSDQLLRSHVIELDLADLRRALAERSIADVDQIVWAYEAKRRAIEKPRTEAKESTAESDEWPKSGLSHYLPAEFANYLAGAEAWHREDLEAARLAWSKVVELPAAERRYRSTWAAFMLGRVNLAMAQAASGPEQARAAAEAERWLRETRAWAAAGFSDPMGLAAESYGWEAQVARLRGDAVGEIRLYLKQLAAGEESAVMSLQFTCAKVLRAPGKDFAVLAKDAQVRRVVTAYFVSHGGRFSWPNTPRLDEKQAWLAALEKVGASAVEEADRLAWLAYDAGDFEQAQRWCVLAPKDSGEAQWISARLALRSGDLPVGEKLLRVAVENTGLGDGYRRRAIAELARVCMAQDNLPGALAAWMRGGYWEDAAFIAERVMTVEELRAFVDSYQVAKPEIVWPINYWSSQEPAEALRALLARRLTRLGKTALAEKYFTPERASLVHQYGEDVKIAFDSVRRAEERSAAFWRSAQYIHANGMDLLGTELEPDWHICSGEYAGVSSTVHRQRLGEENGAFAPTAFELGRFKDLPAPDRRFHYRYRAAELAWWAASLLPNDADETARILATAGNWLKERDPAEANRFYQALVIRCGNTELGREAAKKRWLPKASQDTRASLCKSLCCPAMDGAVFSLVLRARALQSYRFSR